MLSAMTEAQLLKECRTECQQMVAEIEALLEGASPEQLQATMGPKSWHSLQIVDHFVRAHGPYLEACRPVAAQAPAGDGQEVKLKFFTRMIVRQIRKGTVPALPNLVPPPTPAENIVQTWRDLERNTDELWASLQGKSLSHQEFRNPELRIVRMHLADWVEIRRRHLAYHLPQFRARLKC